MAQKASKFVYEIVAEYQGESSLKKLQADLNALGKIDVYRGLEKSTADMEKRLARVSEIARKLGEKAARTGSDTDKGRYERTTREVEKLNRALQAQRSALARSAADLRANGIEADRAAQHYARLQATVQQQGRLAAARSTLGVRSDLAINAEIAGLQKAYRDLAASGRASAGELDRAYRAMQTRIGELRRQTGGWAAQVGQLRTGFAGMAAAIGGLSLARGGLSQFVGFDDTMLRVQALTGATAEKLAGLRDQAKQLGADTRYSAAEAASGMAEMAAAGMTLEQISGSIGAALDMAAVAGMGLGEAANNLTDIMSQFGLAGEKAATHVADVLTAGFTGAATSMQQLNEALSYAGPTAAAFGYSLEDTVAALQVLANTGLKASRGGTALGGILARLGDSSSTAAELLTANNIAIKNTDGTLRDLADILEDIEKAGLDTGEVLSAFGLRAGPGMLNLLKQGSKALRDYQKSMKDVDGLARKKAGLMESGLGGALRALQAATTGVAISMGEALAPSLTVVAEWLTALSKSFSELPGWMQGANAGMLAFVAAGLGIAPILPLFGGLVNSLKATQAAMAATGIAARGLRGWLDRLFVAAGAWELGYAIGSWLNQLEPVQVAVQKLFTLWEAGLTGIRLAWAKAFGSGEEVAAIERELQVLRDMYDNTERDIQAARKKSAEAQKQDQKAVADAAKSANAAMVADAEVTAKELAKTYKSYVDEVKRLQEEASGRQKSLTAELRDMARGGMSDADAWVDQRNAAKEYIKLAQQAADEARRAQTGGDSITAAQRWKEAVQYADDARNAYKALNHEVKSGDQVIISAQTALKGSMRGVKEAGELAIDFLKEQEKAAADAAKEMERTTDLSTLTGEMDEAEKKWTESWRRMRGEVEETAKVVQEYWKNAAGFWTNTDDAFSAGWSKKSADEFTANWNDGYAKFERRGKDAADAVKKAIDRAAEDRQTTIRIRTLETKRWGGLVGAARHMAQGGKVPGGYGGGDKVPAMLEPGEFVLRKEAVKVLSPAFLERLNANVHATLAPLAGLLKAPSRLAGVGGDPWGGPVGIVMELKTPDGESVKALVPQDDAERLARWNRRVSNTRFRR